MVDFYCVLYTTYFFRFSLTRNFVERENIEAFEEIEKQVNPSSRYQDCYQSITNSIFKINGNRESLTSLFPPHASL